MSITVNIKTTIFTVVYELIMRILFKSNSSPEGMPPNDPTAGSFGSRLKWFSWQDRQAAPLNARYAALMALMA